MSLLHSVLVIPFVSLVLYIPYVSKNNKTTPYGVVFSV